MVEPITPDEFTSASETVQAFVQQWLVRNRGRIVKTPGGRYKGRPGVISAAHYGCESHQQSPGTLHVLIMVLSADGGRELNSDGDTRTYWPLRMFEDLTL